MGGKFRFAVSSLALLASVAGAACSRPPLEDTIPPPLYDEPQPPYQTPPAYGEGPGFGPPLPALPPLPEYRDPPFQQQPYIGQPLAGGPGPRSEPEVVILMAPIPNPEDLSAQEYARVYGPGERQRVELAGAPPSTTARARPGAAGTPAQRPAQTAAAPQPRQAPSTTTAPSARPAAPALKAPATPAPAQPAPAQPAPAPKAADPKAAPAQPAKAPAAKAPAAKAPAAAVRSDVEQLGAALAEEVANGSTLVIPEAIAEGAEGIVVLTLPPSLAARIQTEARRVGLGSAASSVDASASLSGEGYEITPSESQTARLTAGESARFSWSVNPQESPSGTLTAEVGGVLKGGSQPRTFSMASIQKAVAAELASEEEASGSRIPQQWVVFGILGALALIILGGVWRASAQRREADRRRRAERRAQELGEYNAPADPKP